MHILYHNKMYICRQNKERKSNIVFGENPPTVCFFVSIRHDGREETPQLGPGFASHPRQEENPTKQGLRCYGCVRGQKWSVWDADARRSHFSCISLRSPQAAQRQPRTHQQIVAFPASVHSASRRIRDRGTTLFQGRPVTFPRRPTSAGRRWRAVSRRTSEQRPPHTNTEVEVNRCPAFDAGEGPARCGQSTRPSCAWEKPCARQGPAGRQSEEETWEDRWGAAVWVPGGRLPQAAGPGRLRLPLWGLVLSAPRGRPRLRLRLPQGGQEGHQEVAPEGGGQEDRQALRVPADAATAKFLVAVTFLLILREHYKYSTYKTYVRICLFIFSCSVIRNIKGLKM